MIIGKCSLCRGDVVCPDDWNSVTPPPIYCTRCGAVKDENGDALPTIKMVDKNKESNFSQSNNSGNWSEINHKSESDSFNF